MKVAIYSPYLDTLGGGERYVATIAEVLSSKAIVHFLLDGHLYNFGAKKLKDRLSDRFNLDLSRVDFIKAPLGKTSNFFKRLIFMMKYDLLFYLTDGSIFYPTAKKNILHIQSPIIGQPSKSLWGRIKLLGWDLIIYNSKFTQNYSQDKWMKKSKVIYPPVDVDKIKPLVKKKYILSVGRFFGYLKDKKHQVLIKVFKELFEENPEMRLWSLHLVGSASKGDQSYLDELRMIAKDLPVNFYPNLGYIELVKLYGQSAIYWHASGYGEDDPTKMEHFGISTAEAMAGGCVPVVIGKGGQVEIVTDGEDGFLWNDLDKLKEYSLQLVNDEKLRKKMSGTSIKKAKKFSKKIFGDNIMNLLESL